MPTMRDMYRTSRLCNVISCPLSGFRLRLPCAIGIAITVVRADLIIFLLRVMIGICLVGIQIDTCKLFLVFVCLGLVFYLAACSI